MILNSLQACVAHAHKDVFNPLREIATNAGENTVLRKTAIHGIGELGNIVDLELLELVRSEDVRCSVASEAAITHLKNRHPAARLPSAAGTGNSSSVNQ